MIKKFSPSLMAGIFFVAAIFLLLVPIYSRIRPPHVEKIFPRRFIRQANIFGNSFVTIGVVEREIVPPLLNRLKAFRIVGAFFSCAKDFRFGN